MKKNTITLFILAIVAITFISACKSAERCEAYKDSRANTHETINQYHSRG
jgi:hypothetical protein